MSGVWRAFCRGIGVTASLSSGYHPQTNGQAEWANQALEATLRCVTTSNPASWSLQLPWIEYSLNTMSPFLCSLGYQPPLFPSQEMEAAVPSIQTYLSRCRCIWKVARDAMNANKDRVQRVVNRQRAPAPAYRPGQRVWLLVRDLPLPTVSRKRAPSYVGPYAIAQVNQPLCPPTHPSPLSQDTSSLPHFPGQAGGPQCSVSACPCSTTASYPQGRFDLGGQPDP